MGETKSSHPAIQFKTIPIVPGPLSRLEHIRPSLLEDVIRKTKEELSGTGLDLLLGEALYSERSRLRYSRPTIFTRERYQGDAALWNSIQAGLVKSHAEVDRKLQLDQVIRHYAEEIGGHFDPRVYRIAVRSVPWGFNWLLNAASVRRFVPWGLTESLSSRLNIVGEVPALKNLAGKGTILLVPTHQSNIDSVLIGYVIYLMSLPPFAYGAGLNLFSNPVLSFFMSRLGSYTVDRKKNNLIYKTTLKNYSSRILLEGIHSIFFPGGGRSRSGAIESKLKLGLLGTGLAAQIEGMQAGRAHSRVYIVPMVVSYHFVLEASSLIEDYLQESGKHQYLIKKDEFWQAQKLFNFFWKFFSSQSDITVRIGKPLDIFGNFVDENGESLGPNGTMIDPARWLTTDGELKKHTQRDVEYTREMSIRLTERFHKENTVLTSHLVAFSFFEALRNKYREFDLFRFLRLLPEQRILLFKDYLPIAEIFHRKVTHLAQRGQLYLCPELQNLDTEAWVKDGIRKLGPFHDAAVVKVQGELISSEDLNLLYYYRNRLAGFGLSLTFDERISSSHLGQYDAHGFLA